MLQLFVLVTLGIFIINFRLRQIEFYAYVPSIWNTCIALTMTCMSLTLKERGRGAESAPLSFFLNVSVNFFCALSIYDFFPRVLGTFWHQIYENWRCRSLAVNDLVSMVPLDASFSIDFVHKSFSIDLLHKNKYAVFFLKKSLLFGCLWT